MDTHARRLGTLLVEMGAIGRVGKGIEGMDDGRVGAGGDGVLLILHTLVT